MPRRYKQGADGQPHPAFYGKLPEEFSKADTMRFMVETDLKLSGCVSADTLAALRAEGYDYKDGNLVPAGKEETMQEKVANTKWNGNPKIVLPRLLHGNLFIAFFMPPTIHTRMTRAKKYKAVTAIQT